MVTSDTGLDLDSCLFFPHGPYLLLGLVLPVLRLDFNSCILLLWISHIHVRLLQRTHTEAIKISVTVNKISVRPYLDKSSNVGESSTATCPTGRNIFLDIYTAAQFVFNLTTHTMSTMKSWARTCCCVLDRTRAMPIVPSEMIADDVHRTLRLSGWLQLHM